MGLETAFPSCGKSLQIDCHVTPRVEPFDEAALLAHLIEQKVEVLGPAAYNFGAEGVGLSLYFSDPDGNIIELKGSAHEPRIHQP